MHPKLVSILFSVHNDDKTLINYGEYKDTEVDITSDIRQGCTDSTFFNLVAYKIMKKLE